MWSLLKTIVGIAAYPIRVWLEDKIDDKKFNRKIEAQIVKSESDRMKYIQLRLAKSWLDEIAFGWILLFVSGMFVPRWQPYYEFGITQMKSLPEWMTYVIIGGFTSALGIASYHKWRRQK